MAPVMAFDNQMDCSVSEPKRPGDGCLAFAVGGARFNLAGNFAGELLGVAALDNGMADVVFMGNPGQVCGGIVGPIEIPVMDTWQIVWIGDECIGYEPGNKYGFLPTVLAKNGVMVASLVEGPGQHFPLSEGPIRGALVGNASVNAPHPSQVGHFVETFIVSDGEPSFTNIHAGEFTPCGAMVQGQRRN